MKLKEFNEIINSIYEPIEEPRFSFARLFHVDMECDSGLNEIGFVIFQEMILEQFTTR